MPRLTVEQLNVFGSALRTPELITQQKIFVDGTKDGGLMLPPPII